MTTYSAVQMQTVLGEIATFQALAIQAATICNALKASGTTLFNDAVLTGQWPTDGATIKTALSAANGPITTFLAAIPTISLPVS